MGVKDPWSSCRLGSLSCDPGALPHPARPHFLAFFLFSPFVLVNKMLSYLLGACARLGALLLFILPAMLSPKIFALVPSAHVSPQSCFPWKLRVVSMVTLKPIALVCLSSQRLPSGAILFISALVYCLAPLPLLMRTSGSPTSVSCYILSSRH